MTPPPRLVCIPSRDVAFAADARRLAGSIPSNLRANDALAWFAAELRRAYPTVTVREQSELARSHDADRVWYVTRRDHEFRIDVSLHVELPPPAAFEAYVERVAEWQTAVVLSARHATPDLVGTEYDAAYTFLGRTYHGIFRILAADPPRSVTLEAVGSGISVVYRTTFEADGTGSFVRVQGDYTLPDNVLARVVDRLGLERAITRDIERANETYRRLCDTLYQGILSRPSGAVQDEAAIG